MCGIAGFTSPGRDADGIIGAMLARIAHRGPDGEGSYVTDAIAFGHLRLAIVDLVGGTQPRVDPQSGDALIFNGEIYGFRALADELRRGGVALRDHSDTEVLFQLLRRHGVGETLARIDGMFAFAYYHAASATLSLARDRFGEKPLYWARRGGALIFGSEAQAVRAHPACADDGPDVNAAYALLQFEYLPGHLSGWAGVEKLPPASVLTWRHGEAVVTRYWSPPLPGGDSPADPVDRLDMLLQDALARQIIADVPVGVFLSGGIDSSLITALAAQLAPNITALTVRAGTGDFDETEHAVAVARHLGVRHEIVDLHDTDMLAAMDAIAARLSEPLADSSLLPTYLVCRAARARMTVALGGDGADELFAGYPNIKVQRFAAVMALFPGWSGSLVTQALRLLPPGRGYMNFRFRLGQLAQGFGTPSARQSYHWMAPFGPGWMADLWADGAVPGDAPAACFGAIDDAAASASGHAAQQILLHQFLLTYLPDDILMKTDRAAMFNSLEVRAPFLDRRFAEYACALPLSVKLGPSGGKHILKQVARRYLPAAIIERKKHGFAVPIGNLLRTLFAERLTDTMLSRANPVAPWFKRATLERLVAEHLSGRHDHGKRLWALLILFTVCGQTGRTR